MQCLIISGMGGAGKSLSVDVLEDLGYYCVDNMPAPLILPFAELFMSSGAKYKRCAFVVDARGDGDFHALFETMAALSAREVLCRVLFLDCSDEVIINRYKESRRRHPLDTGGVGVAAALRTERALLEPVRARADYLVDTTALSSGGLREHLHRLFGEEGDGQAMVVSITTFGYKHGIPHESDLVFDVRCFKNPYYVPALRPLTGMDAAVCDYVFSAPEAEELAARLRELMGFLIPLYIREGKTSLVLSIGCTGGQHRSVAFGCRLARELEADGWQVLLRHRDCPHG